MKDLPVIPIVTPIPDTGCVGDQCGCHGVNGADVPMSHTQQAHYDMTGNDLRQPKNPIEYVSHMPDPRPMVEAPPKASFNKAADKTFADAMEVHAQRGTEYSDSWHLDNVHAPVLRMTLKEIFGFEPSREELRIIMAASLVDVKDSRYVGGWKMDTAIDGLNYRAAHAAWMQEYVEAHTYGNDR